MTRLPAPLSPLLRRIVLADAAFEFIAALLISGLVGKAHFWLNVAQGVTVTGAVAFALLGAGLAGAAIYRGTTEGFVRVLAFANVASGAAIWLAALARWSQFEPEGQWLVAFVADGCLALGALQWLALRRGV